MAQSKKMNESFFVKLQKDLTAAGELIRARQEEKQSLMDEFESECKRFFFGKISERALAVSVQKTNAELKRLDASIREAMARARDLSSREMALVSAQAPIGYKATLSGIVGGKIKKKGKKKKAKKKTVKRKKAAKKKPAKRRTKKVVIPSIRKILKKEKTLDRKFSKKK